MIGAEELAGDLSECTLLDVRWRLVGPSARADYDVGHLPGACFVDLDRELAGPPGEHGRHPLPAVEDFQAAMRRAGVRADRRVVCYDAGDNSSAARCWWLLRFSGHQDVRVLDGGYAAWRAVGGEISDVVPEPETGDFVATSGHLPLLDAEGAAAVAATGVLLDARSHERYRGLQEPIDPVAGHIPGAVSAFGAENLTADGRFRSAEELRARFAALGVVADRPVGTYCGSGVVAAQQVLALTIAGFEDAGLYVDSWSGWITDPARPVATGPDPDPARG